MGNTPTNQPDKTEAESGAKKGDFMKADMALVRELAELLNDTGLTEIEVVDGTRKIRVAGNTPSPVASAPMAYAPAPNHTYSPAAFAVPTPAASSDTPAPATIEGTTIKSPMVGTAYLASEPGSPEFVSIGKVVKPGDTLVIIEAMKVMNPITAPVAGTVKAIMIANAQPIEYDQPLVVIG